MTVFRSDRKLRGGGGVICYLREDLSVSSEFKHSNSYCDSLGLYIPELDLALITVYRPPGCPCWNFKESLEEITTWLRGLETKGNSTPTILVSGDFNLGFLNSWDFKTIEELKAKSSNRAGDGRSVAEDKKQALFLIEFAEEFFLAQHIDQGTRRQNILDLIFTNNDQLITRCYQIINSTLSDHNTICCELSYGLKPLEQKGPINFSSTQIPEYDTAGADEEDWLRVNTLLQSIDWEAKFEGMSTTQMSECLLSELEKVVVKILKKKSNFSNIKSADQGNTLLCGTKTENHISKISEITRSRNKIPKNVRTLFRKKKKASDGLTTVKSVKRCLELRKKLEKSENELKDLYKERKFKLENVALAKIKRNPGAFYSYARRHSKTFSGIGPFLDTNGNPLKESEAEALKSQYEKVFSTPKEESKVENPKEFFKESPNEQKIDYIHFDFEDIQNAIDQLSSNAAAGPDGVPAILLKKCKFQLSDPLFKLWSKSMETGEIPEIFKLAHVCPLHKPGTPRASPSSYRPVSLTSHLVKTFERVIKKSLQNHLEHFQKLSDAQHGFRSKRSCLSQLLKHYDDILKGLENGQNVDTIYLDFSKAFDKVDKGILARRMKEMGIHGRLGEWIFNFLSGRQQIIIANGTQSTPSEVTSGVPQGTVLGPLLFLILINSIGQSDISSIISLFADDTRLTKYIKEENDVEEFQEDLETIYQWSNANNMVFNGTKFEVLKYGKDENLKDDFNYLTPNSEELIERKEVVKDLGILMNDKATFDDHINKVCAKVTQKAGWVLRTFLSREIHFMKLMWKQLIQPHIDYGSQLWQPPQSMNLQRIEKLQQTYTKKITKVRNENYWKRLQMLKLNSQQRRLERYRIIYVWKSIEGLVPDLGLKVKYCPETRRGRLCEIPTISKGASERIKTLRDQSINVHGARLFNAMPESIRNLTGCSDDDFKEKLDQYLTHIPDQPMVGDLLPLPLTAEGKHSNSLIDQVRDYKNRQ